MPGVAVHMITALFPKTRRILSHELQTAQPFGAFPAIEMWHHEA